MSPISLTNSGKLKNAISNAHGLPFTLFLAEQTGLHFTLLYERRIFKEGKICVLSLILSVSGYINL